MNKDFLDILENKLNYQYSDLNVEKIKNIYSGNRTKEYDEESFIYLLNQGKENNQILYDLFRKYKLENYISEDFLKRKLNRNSTINFFRYFNNIIKHIYKRNFYLDVDNLGNINLQIYAKNQERSYLDLVFENDGQVSYLCLDKKFDKSETKTFVMKGQIETSNKLSKAYKINRLLFLILYLDYEGLGEIENYLDSYVSNKITYKNI
jgi:hypothetical protein